MKAEVDKLDTYKYVIKLLTTSFHADWTASKLTKEQSQKCEGVFIEEDLLKALKKLPNNKSPGNDRITKNFCEAY